MKDNTSFILKLTEKLSAINPFLVLLFGSYAYGTPHKDSDFDLLVVTDDNFIPQNFEEHLKVQLSVSQVIFDLAMEAPIDLLVYTRPMFEKFKAQQSLFAQEIITKGIIIYEKYNKTVA